jgi:hypothetical protein
MIYDWERLFFLLRDLLAKISFRKGNHMGLKRFEEIHRMFKINLGEPGSSEDASLAHRQGTPQWHKVEPLLLLYAQLARDFTSGTSIAVDNAILPFPRRCTTNPNSRRNLPAKAGKQRSQWARSGIINVC